MTQPASHAKPKLPSGHVTFVFTDIEGSTRLYKSIGEEAAGDVFDLHNQILRSVWTAHRGHEVHTEGDSFFVAFEAADDAVAACVEVQQRLAATEWPSGGEVKVRIGIHSGLAAPRSGDYMALSVHQAARVMSAANGQQVLITESTVDRMTSADELCLVSLGALRLRDFDEPPVVLRIDPDNLAPNETPPRATPANHHNLVSPLTSFIGRGADVVTVNGLLEPGRAVTLVGPGGMGKTRLATEVGLEVAPTWDGGVWFVELAEIIDAELVVDEIAAAIGAPSTGSARWHDVYDFVGEQAMLVILDNVEHLVDACAQFVPQLLRSCPNLAVLSTSREPLNSPGEVVYRVRPLDLSEQVDDPTELPSVELFIDRARAISQDLVWTPEALDDVLAICQHLDGLPLAIEIAAAQVGMLQVGEIRAGLNNRFRLLRSRDRALPDRQRTMEGLLGWSYRLLDETEQRALCRLAVFGGSFGLDAAEAALTQDDLHRDDVPEVIWALVDKSLISADFTDSATRYRLFESVQHYAMRLLIDNDDPVRVAVALAQWLLDQIAPWLVNDRRWLGEIALERANIRVVVDLIAEAEPELAQQLMCSVGRYHDSMQSYQAGLEELVPATQTLANPTSSRVALLAEVGYLHLRMADIDAASAVIEQARVLQDEVGPPHWNDVAVERSLGEIAARAGDHQAVLQIARSAISRGVSPIGSARMWSLIGIAESTLGNLEVGLDALERALATYVEENDAAHIAIARGNVAEAAYRLGNFETAATRQRECLEDGLAIGQQLAIANSLIMASRLAERRQDWSRALAMQAHAQSMLHHAHHELYEDEYLAIQDMIDRATTVVGAKAVAQHIEAGQQLPIIDVAEMAFTTFAHEVKLDPHTTST